MPVSVRLLIVCLFTFAICSGGQEPPLYSQADGYITAPQANGLPVDRAEMARMYPGMYEDFQGVGFLQYGLTAGLAPDQEVADFPHADWAKPTTPRRLRIAAVINPCDVGGNDAYMIGLRLGAEVKQIPVFLTDKQKPPRGVINTEVAMDKLRAVLAEDIDVILVNKMLGSLPDEAQQLILEKVEAGTGLVTVPFLPQTGPLVEALGLANPGARCTNTYRDFSKIAPGDSWLTGGVLFDLFPSRNVDGLVPWSEYDPRNLNVVTYQPKSGADLQAHGSLGNIPMILTGTLGKGRVVHIAWQANIWVGSYLPLYGADDDDHAFRQAKHYEEQMFSILSKSVQFAVQGQPSCRLIWPHPLVGSGVRIANAGEATQVTLGIRLRDPITWELLGEQNWQLELAKGAQIEAPTLDLPMPVLHGTVGEAPPLLEYSLRDLQGNPLDYGNTRLAASGKEPLVTVEAVVAYPEQTPALTIRPGAAVTWQAVDTWGRVVDSGQSTGGRVEIKTDRLSDLLTVIVDQRDAQQHLLARTTQEIWTPTLEHPRDFYNLVWRNPNVWSTVRDFNCQVMRRQGGINTALAAGNFNSLTGAEYIVRSGSRVALTNMVPRWPYMDLADWPVTHEKRLAMYEKMIPGRVGRLDPVTIHLMDERHSRRRWTKGFEISAAALAEFRQWLQREYGTIDQLNAVWLTEYTSFDEAVPPTDPQEVVKHPMSYARWMDLLRWGDIEIALKKDLEFVKFLQDDTQNKVSVGYEGIFAYYGTQLAPYAGLNIPAIFDSGVNMNNMPYAIGSPTWEMCASLNPQADTGTWLGYESGRETYQYEPWRGVLSGATFMGWFADSLWFTPTGAVGARLNWIEQYTRPLRQGVGRMMNESTREFDEVAILANMRSAQLSWIYGIQRSPETNGRDFHEMNRPAGASNQAILEICRDYGISPAYITEGQITSGRLDQFKVLIQPFDLSVDPEVAAAIAAWVERGGTLIADMGAGAYDEHGKMQEDAPINAVYGIKRNGPFTITSEAGDFSVGLLEPTETMVRNGSGLGNWYMVEYFEPNLEATTAKAAGVYALGGPHQMCFWNDYGKGHALYLGFLLNRYRGDEQDALSALPLLHSAFRGAGVEPKVRITAGGGPQLNGFTITNFRDGQLRYNGIIKRSQDAPKEVTAIYPEPRHVYNVMANEYLGYGTQIALNLESELSSKSGMPFLDGETIESTQDTARGMALLAALPYRIGELGISAQTASPGAAMPLSVTIASPDGPVTERHVVYLDVRDPEGNSAEPYCQTIVVEKGAWTGTLPLAENDRPGTWTLTIREPITATTTSTKVQVK